MSADFIFKGSATDLDPDLNRVIQAENERQDRKVILVASESIAPEAVRELMSSRFGNIYAEGYPPAAGRLQSQEELLDIEAELARYRRHSDPRYYKGVEYADILEALTRRRAAELFATNGVTADDLFVNVQPMSGSPANIAVYSALLQPGDTIMGLDLIHGGHLTHGSRVSRSGMIYNAIPYRVDPKTERLNFEEIEALALEHRPQLIVAGFTAYPLTVDWQQFRAIADKCGAYLMADIAHISGLVAAGIHPSPIGIADVVTMTTHKSLCGPRGAMIITHRQDLSHKIDRSVFPGEQGGPHLNTMTALALALKLANSEKFRALQARVAQNARRLAKKLEEHGLRIVAGGSDNHLLMVDTKSIRHQEVHLSGDMAARILDVAGIVTNRNTIPGDSSAFAASGVRIGTVWISQLGYGDEEIDLLAEAIAVVLKGCKPFFYDGLGGKRLLRAKVDFQALQTAREIIARLTGKQELEVRGRSLLVRGPAAASLLNPALTSDLLSLSDGDAQPSHMFGDGLDLSLTVQRESTDHFWLHFASEGEAGAAAQWLLDLSDGYVLFDDLHAKLPGPAVVLPCESSDPGRASDPSAAAYADGKPYFVGWQKRPEAGQPLPTFDWTEPEDSPLRRTALYDSHIEMGGRMVPFGGWDMPVWYSSVGEEHKAVRETAGLFDVSHMGVLEVSGASAEEFLNIATTNDVSSLKVGRSHYSYLLQPDGSVIDDLLVYRLEPDRFMLVVNASNNDKDWAWLNAINEGRVQIDSKRSWVKVQRPATLRDLRDPKWGDACRVDLAIQGPLAGKILTSMCDDVALLGRIEKLPWAGLTQGNLAGIDVIISRTGYTGERIAYELFVHPARSRSFWKALQEAGEAFGLHPCGLAARDSTRTEAGLPLYGHELAGPLNLNPAEAGFGSYLKLWKPFFVGRNAYIAARQQLSRTVVRFQMNEKGVRRPELGDPVLDRRGKVVGTVTSCAIDSSGYLLGQAVVPPALSDPGGTVGIYQLGGGKRKLSIPSDIRVGARLPVPDQAIILDRFPKRSR